MSAPRTAQAVDLSVDLAGLKLVSPLMTASGTSGYSNEYAQYLDFRALGAFVTKSITVHPRAGNPPPRIVETRAGMLNAIGLANIGLERFVTEKVPELAKLGCPVIVNVAGHSVEEYVALCERLGDLAPVAGIELNVSCPNVADGLTFGTDANRLADLVRAVRPVVRRGVLIVKLSPNVTDITLTAAAAADAGADALSLVNTFQGMAIDAETWRPVLANRTGGLSGPAIKPMALHMVHQVYSKVARDRRLPLIAMGGIQTWSDAVEFLLAGASALAIGTSLFIDPGTPQRIIEGLQAYLGRRNLKSVRQLIGQLKS
ncbi:MAG TPA: dihydroorotate dehydrogenase [Phycisphaerae bacterium]|nr:dihydroorotate dehydrogenase [Phycisphaerae bacterium]